MAESIKLFLPNGEAKYFCDQGWTAESRNSLSGKSPRIIPRESGVSSTLRLLD
jgi:hypothetical protein